MPIYEYTCKACEEKFEQLVRSMSNTDKVKCPKCGSSKTARALSVFSAPSGNEPSAYIPNRSSAPTCGHCGGAPGSCSR